MVEIESHGRDFLVDCSTSPFMVEGLLFMLQRQWLSVEAFCFTSKTENLSPKGDLRVCVFEFFSTALKPASESHGRD